MKVRELKEKLARLEGDEEDFEIFVAPLVKMDVMGDSITKPTKAMSPSPFEFYKITTVVQAGSVGGEGVYNLHLLFGFDDSVNYGSANEDTEKDELIN